MAAHMTTLAWIYIGIAAIWTAAFVGIMAFLWHHRRLPHLQMRRLPLVFAAMSMLHLYGVLCYVAYGVGMNFPCQLEFWDMNLLLPAGIALFQIANSQFLHIASQQKKYVSVQGLGEHVRGKDASALDGRAGGFWQKTMWRIRHQDRITRMVVYVSIGIAIQVLLSLIIFLLSEKFHHGWGVVPNDFLGTDSQTRLNCARGWEWWLSIFWQIFWAWIYAPYILWKSRAVDDTHGWRLQTIACCLSGLPASPLWLCALYVDAFQAKVNRDWIAPQWFVLSITLIEGFTLLVPCWHVYKQHKLRTDTLAAIASWEAKNNFGSIAPSWTNSSTQISLDACDNSEKGLLASSKAHKRSGSQSSRRSHMYTMTALEHALRWNATPLQRFAALKDFSGENISFLTHLADWQKKWGKPARGSTTTQDQIRAQYNRAVNLYAALVAVDHAEFPVNISSRTLKHLDDMFAKSAERLLGDTQSQSTYNSATPFDDVEDQKSAKIVAHELPRLSNDSYSPDNVDVPPRFGPNVFDEAEAEIKYLVLTNTWPKFVNAGCAEQLKYAEGKDSNSRISQFFHLGTTRLDK